MPMNWKYRDEHGIEHDYRDLPLRSKINIAVLLFVGLIAVLAMLGNFGVVNWSAVFAHIFH